MAGPTNMPGRMKIKMTDKLLPLVMCIIKSNQSPLPTSQPIRDAAIMQLRKVVQLDNLDADAWLSSDPTGSALDTKVHMCGNRTDNITNRRNAEIWKITIGPSIVVLMRNQRVYTPSSRCSPRTC